jgi:hypothetical protein
MTSGSALRVGEALVQTLWVGALWVVGYLVAPALFTHLESTATAGRLAGELFSVVSVLSMICGILLLLALRGHRLPQAAGRIRASVIVMMMAMIAAGEWLVRPMMEAARMPDGTPGDGFGLLHGISAALYLIASIGGIFLVGSGSRSISPAE